MIALTPHWPQSEKLFQFKFNSNTNWWNSRSCEIFCWAFVLSLGIYMEFKLTWVLITGIICSSNWQVWPVALTVSHHILIAGSGTSTRHSRITFRRDIRSRGWSFISQGQVIQDFASVTISAGRCLQEAFPQWIHTIFTNSMPRWFQWLQEPFFNFYF